MSDDGRSPNVRELVMGVLFAGIGLFMLVMPKTKEKQTLFVILGLVNLAVGIIKIARGVKGD
jgi:uncharacterized membrane protein HdeD (DUF308 family)